MNERKAKDMRPATQLKSLPITSIRRSPYQPRKSFSQAALLELAGSIRNYGLLQPVSVRFVRDGVYELIAGERRFRACKLLGYTSIAAIVHYDRGETESAMLAMIENLQRENLHFFEEAEGYVTLLREHGLTQEALAKKLSKNQSTIANKMRLLRLPKAVKEKLVQTGLTERHARALLRLHNEEIQLKLLSQIAEKNCSVRETEAMVEKELKRLYDDMPEKSGKVKFLFSDCRIYINTVKKAVQQIREAGIAAEMDISDTGAQIDIHISITKPPGAAWQQHTVVV